MSSHKTTDIRFKHVHTDPRFRKNKQVVKQSNPTDSAPDARFAELYNKSSQFNNNIVVDRFGAVRRLKTKQFNRSTPHDKHKESDESKAHSPTEHSDTTGNSTNDNDVSDTSDVEGNVLSTRDMAEPSSADNDSSNDSDDDLFSGSDVEYAPIDNSTGQLKLDHAAYDGFSHSDSDSDGSDMNDNELDEVELMNETVHENEHIDTIEHSTNRLAICNLEWDCITSTDIYVLLNNFITQNSGTIHSVVIYMSEYGKQKLSEEERYGPQITDDIDEKQRKYDEIDTKAQLIADSIQDNENIDSDSDNNNNDDDDDDDAILNDLLNPVDEDNPDTDQLPPIEMEKLRRYELDRLKYYYCIVTCSNIATAESLYKQCDGLEFESSSNLLDIRYVPDHIIFDSSDIHNECNELPSNYKIPDTFFTRALQHTRVELNWDKSDTVRDNILREQWNNILGHNKSHTKHKSMNNDDISAYIAGDMDGTESDAYLTDAIVETSDSDASGIDDSGYESAARRGKKRVLLKRRARARYSILLDDIKQLKSDLNNEQLQQGERTIVYNPDIQKLTERFNPTHTDHNNHLTVWDKVLEKRQAKKRAKRQQKYKDNDIVNSNSGSTNHNADADADQPFSDDDIDEMDQQVFSDDINTDSDTGTGTGTAKTMSNKQKKQNKKNVLNKSDAQPNQQADAELELLMLNDDITDRNQQQQQQSAGYSLKQLLKQQKLKSVQQHNTTNRTQQLSNSIIEHHHVTTEYNNNNPAANEFQLDLHDTRFQSLYTDPKYHIDRTDRYYKATPGNEAIVEYRQQQRKHELTNNENNKNNQNQHNASTTTAAAAHNELSTLVDSVKRKSNAATAKLKQNKRIKM